MKIAAFDPGRTTGYCVVDFHDNDVGKILDMQEITWDERFRILPILANKSYGQRPGGPFALDVIVVESFHLYNHEFKHQVGSEFPSVRVIGIIEAGCWNYDLLHLLHFIPPSSKKYVKVLNEDVAKCGSEHIKDAYQLARYWYATKGIGTGK